jgi:hypothetical protein
MLDRAIKLHDPTNARTLRSLEDIALACLHAIVHRRDEEDRIDADHRLVERLRTVHVGDDRSHSWTLQTLRVVRIRRHRPHRGTELDQAIGDATSEHPCRTRDQNQGCLLPLMRCDALNELRFGRAETSGEARNDPQHAAYD